MSGPDGLMSWEESHALISQSRAIPAPSKQHVQQLAASISKMAAKADDETLVKLSTEAEVFLGWLGTVSHPLLLFFPPASIYHPRTSSPAPLPRRNVTPTQLLHRLTAPSLPPTPPLCSASHEAPRLSSPPFRLASSKPSAPAPPPAPLPPRQDDVLTRAYSACILANIAFLQQGQMEILGLGGVSMLVRIISRKEDRKVILHCVAALQNLTYKNADCCVELIDKGDALPSRACLRHSRGLGCAGGEKALKKLLKKSPDEAMHQYAAGAVANLMLYRR